MMTLILWRFFASNPHERPENNGEQAALMLVLAAALVVDGMAIAAVISWPWQTLVFAGVLAILWHVAGMFRADDDEREEATR